MAGTRAAQQRKHVWHLGFQIKYPQRERYAPHVFAGATGIEMAQLDMKTINEENGVAPLFMVEECQVNMDSICSPQVKLLVVDKVQAS